MKHRVLIIVVALVALALTGCNMLNISTENGMLKIDVNLSESQVNNLLAVTARNSTSSDILLDDITSVDLIAPNTVRVFGTADGVEGSYDLTMDAVDGALKIAVVAVDVPGVTLDDPRITEANDALARAFVDQLQSPDDGRIAAVAVVDDQLRFSFEAPVNQ